MSNILIKGMDMPKACNNCRFHNAYICTAKNSPVNLNVYLDDKKPYDCPLVKIPASHGRLIDADRLLSVIERNSYRLKNFYNSCDEGMFLSGIKQAISEAPTIIEAEE